MIGTDPRVSWMPWVDPAALPALVASHDVCLGIFGTGPKARRVVPNKVYQGAAAGCLVITSNTAPQRRALGDAAVYVEPGDGQALADALLAATEDRTKLVEMQQRASERARQDFRAEVVVQPLLAVLDGQGVPA
jgi:glycosyltransferase involved in cell wall biosynthesis